MSSDQDGALLEWLLSVIRDQHSAHLMIAGARRRTSAAVRLATTAPGPALYVSGAAQLLESVWRREAGGAPAPLFMSGPMDQDEFAVRAREVSAGTVRLTAMPPERLWHARVARALRAAHTRLVILETSGLALGAAERGVLLATTIERLAHVLPDVPVLTITHPTAGAQHLQGHGAHIRRVGAPFPHRALPRLIEVVDESARLSTLLAAIRRADGHALLLAPTRGEASALAQHLRDASLETSAYHAGLSLSERAALLDGFRSGRLRLLVATAAIQLEADLPCPALLAFTHPPASLDSLVLLAELCETAPVDIPLLIVRGPRDPEQIAAQREPGFPSPAAVHRAYLGLQRRAVRGSALVQIEAGRGFLRGRGHNASISLALLGSAGLIVRRSDFSRAITVEQLAELAAALAPLDGALQLRRGVPVPADPLHLAVQLGWPPHKLHAWLLNAEERGLLRLRAFGREALYSLPSRSAEAEQRLEALIEQAGQEADASAGRLRAWLLARQCRAQALARLLGWDPQPRCGHCDWCIDAGAGHA